MMAAQMTHNGHGMSQPGYELRVMEKVLLTFVAVTNHHRNSTVMPKVR